MLIWSTPPPPTFICNWMNLCIFDICLVESHTHTPFGLSFNRSIFIYPLHCRECNSLHEWYAMQYNKFISALVVSHFSVSHTRNHSCRLFPLSSFAHHNRNSENCFFFNSLACVFSIISFLIWRFILIFQHVLCILQLLYTISVFNSSCLCVK